MANNPRAFDTRQREAHQRAYLTAPTIAEQMPGIDEISADLHFLLANGKFFASPHKRIFTPDMQAHFELFCPDRDCVGGGFDLGAAVQAAVSSRQHESSGTLQCRGGRRGESCAISLRYSIQAQPGDK